jgi:hypothetical protein
MKSRVVLFAAILLSFSFIIASPGGVRGQEQKPQPPSCITDVSVERLGQVMPPDASGRALVTLRVTIAPGGSIQAHTHPGTLVVVIESGEFEYTMLDHADLSVMRAQDGGGEAVSEPVEMGVPVILQPGDWFPDPEDMVHSASNPGNVPTVALVSGLVDPDQPFTQCVEDGTPVS